MEIALIISSVLLLAFALLALIDGFYLHIIKYQLHNIPDSKFEHATHTIRAILFPAIVYFLFIVQNSNTCFYVGLLLVALDIIVLGIDAYSEKDSRAFMGGLPRWEYILHLFVNGFHFASIAVFLAVKLHLTDKGVEIIQDLSVLHSFTYFKFIAINLLPGAILLACIHLMTSFAPTQFYWNKWRAKVQCC